MVRLKLTVGKNLSASREEDGLKTFYHSPYLLVQGSSDVQIIKSGKEVFCFGGIVFGTRLSSGEIEPWSSPAILQSLEGRFVLIRIQDERSAWLCCDRYGQMDIYYQKLDDKIVFATDLDLLPLRKDTAAYDQTALIHNLCVYGYRPPKQHTLYQGVRRLGVGQWVDIQKGKSKIEEIAFQPMAVNEAYGDWELHRYADLFLEAVALRGSTKGNVVLLSSGWDSTALLACLVKLFGSKKVRGVTARMLYSERSGVVNQFELDRAKAIADYFNIRLDVVDLDYRKGAPEHFQSLRPLLSSHQLNSFTALSVFSLIHFIAQSTHGEEVIFQGELSDGAHNLGFSQYSTVFHPVEAFREYSDKMASYLFGPTFLGLFENGEFIKDPIYQFFKGRHQSNIFDEPAKEKIARRKQLLASFFLRAQRLPLWSLQNNKILTERGRLAYTEECESVYFKRAAQELTPQTLYSWYLHLYNSFHWQSAQVAQRTIIAEANGLRVVTPFWDSRLQKFLSQMPESWGRGLDFNPTKYPLKWMLKNRVDYPIHLQKGPHSYLSDVNPNFSHSAEILYASSFAPYFRQLLSKRRGCEWLSEDFFDHAYIDSMISSYLSNREARGPEISDLLALCSLSLISEV